MSIFEKMDFYGHEELVFARDEETGLKAIIAIHDTTLGLSLIHILSGNRKLTAVKGGIRKCLIK